MWGALVAPQRSSCGVSRPGESGDERPGPLRRWCSAVRTDNSPAPAEELDAQSWSTTHLARLYNLHLPKSAHLVHQEDKIDSPLEPVSENLFSTTFAVPAAFVDPRRAMVAIRLDLAR